MSFFTLTLVRHGQTTANKEGILQGQSNTAVTELSEEGRRQAKLVGQRLQTEHFTHIFSSDLERAAKTAEAIKESNRVSSCPIVYDKLLRERHFGSLQGRPGTEFREILKSSKEDWKPPGGGEKLLQVQQRALQFFEDLCQQMRHRHVLDQSSPCCEDTSCDNNTPAQLTTVVPGDDTLFPMDHSPRPHSLDRHEDDVPSLDSALSSDLSEPDSPFDPRDSDLRTIRTTTLSGACPNVSLSPLVEQRYQRFSSVSSGRNSFEDTDYMPPNVSDVLVVSHGGWIRELMRVFINEYGCRMNSSNRHALVISPNTGISRFVVNLPEDGTKPKVTSVFLHDSSHLDADYKTMWDL